jgi:hypothetical protein
MPQRSEPTARLVACAVALMIAIALAFGPVGPDRASARGSSSGCFPKSARTVAKGASGRVFTLRGTTYACLFSAGRPLELGESDDESYFPQRPVINGRYAAYAMTYCVIDSCKSFIEIVDVKRRRVFRATATSRACEGLPSEECDNDDTVTALVLKTNGSVAWSLCDWPDGCEVGVAKLVMRFDSHDAVAGAPAELGSGPGIAKRSLTLSADRSSVSWLDGGRRIVAAID